MDNRTQQKEKPMKEQRETPPQSPSFIERVFEKVERVLSDLESYKK